MSPIRPVLLLTVFATLCVSSSQGAEVKAKGVVYDDRNGNQMRDAGESGVAGIKVSNQELVTLTDEEGRWALPGTDDCIFFVIKPSGWAAPLNEHRLPQFYYIHKPAGSPKALHAGVAPTGPLPESIDFPLSRQTEPDRFKAIFFGDPQPRDQKEIDYIAHDVIEELVGTDAKFGVTLGDILFDGLQLFGSMNATVALVGVPWYNVIGNHDINRDAPTDELSDETFESVYGPAYYSFDYGKVHFIVLDDVNHLGKGKKYKGGLGEKQLAFIKNDLESVPDEQLVVLMMHIPLGGVQDKEELFRLIEKRPYTLSISGHTHWQAHQFMDAKDGWRGEEPHHHIVNVTVSGSWWKGAKDELGIPHTMMRDGAPNGYSMITFDGHEATFDFKVARSPEDYQMNIHAPELVERKDLGKAWVYVNVFAGSSRSTVEMRVAGGNWVKLKKHVAKDPYYVAVREREIKLNPDAPALNSPTDSDHLWRGHLPAGTKAGTHLIEVKTTDMYGRTFQGRRVIRIR